MLIDDLRFNTWHTGNISYKIKKHIKTLQYYKQTCNETLIKEFGITSFIRTARDPTDFEKTILIIIIIRLSDFYYNDLFYDLISINIYFIMFF